MATKIQRLRFQVPVREVRSIRWPGYIMRWQLHLDAIKCPSHPLFPRDITRPPSYGAVNLFRAALHYSRVPQAAQSLPSCFHSFSLAARHASSSGGRQRIHPHRIAGGHVTCHKLSHRSHRGDLNKKLKTSEQCFVFSPPDGSRVAAGSKSGGFQLIKNAFITLGA
jgi:hypothetical protein